ncbi:TIGR02302 family protein [Fulvimarina sp. 2208YS6-2-32]|uniref:TIGR02302 family protein n=1 Tax=Fulvimarina uroteuthidis TaxID=3098149 RepID=A0ABU5I0I5_9HYPH|nr:TIGR02302 family protein [Fulvimarina sp. 2208YS6-2-32]MDY8108902.1 TIGR02302 family protein [Fulvimarina sp. 2208YS6-2-32]
MTDSVRERPSEGAGNIAATRRSAKAALLVERSWPLLLSLGCIVAGFLILAWFGVFAAMAFWLRIAVLAAFVGVAGFAIVRNRRIRWPTGAETDARIETSSALRHQPLRTQGDTISRTSDPFAAALWREHKKRMAETLRHLSGGPVRTQTERLDPYGLRALVLLLFVTSFAYSFGPGGGRVADAFAIPRSGIQIAERRVDAWVTPPGYTGRAPMFLAGPSVEGEPVEGPITVPEGSALSVRVSDASGIEFSYTPERDAAEIMRVLPSGTGPAQQTGPVQGSPDPQADASSNTEPSGPASYELALTESGTATLSSTLLNYGNWQIEVTPDADPQISFTAEPSRAERGDGLELAYRVVDDYGVKSAIAEIVVADDQVAQDARPLIEPPEIRLSLPRRSQDGAQARTAANLEESPYAGADVALTLVATDAAGQTGRSETKQFTLPERAFSNPLARAIIEQRRLLALDVNAVPRVVEMLDAVTLHGDTFIEDSADYLAIKAARARIATAYDDDGLISAVDFLWEIALGIEDGNLSLAEQRLRDAREELADALENGASDEEIDQAMQELREAMQEYLEEYARAMQNQPPQNQQQMGDMQELRQQDLEDMLDRIEDLAKSGSKDAAQQLLSELQQMMDSLQAMRPGEQQQQQGQSQMQEQMDRMGELLQEQQRLMDQTYDLGRRQYRQEQQQNRQRLPGEPRENGQPQPGGEPQQGEPMSPEEFAEMMEELQKRQGALQEQLEQLQGELGEQGLEPSDDLGEAGEAMGQAEGALGEGNDGRAVGEQGRAMEAMRRGAQDMMDQMQQAQGQGQPGGTQGEQSGQGTSGQGMGGRQQQSGRDPLGRQRQTQGPQFGQDVGVPDEIDAQRAREILEEIRDRLGDQLSPDQERRYLERLLETP